MTRSVLDKGINPGKVLKSHNVHPHFPIAEHQLFRYRDPTTEGTVKTVTDGALGTARTESQHMQRKPDIVDILERCPVTQAAIKRRGSDLPTVCQALDDTGVDLADQAVRI